MSDVYNILIISRFKGDVPSKEQLWITFPIDVLCQVQLNLAQYLSKTIFNFKSQQYLSLPFWNVYDCNNWFAHHSMMFCTKSSKNCILAKWFWRRQLWVAGTIFKNVIKEIFYMYFANIYSLGLDFIRSFIWTHLIPLYMKRDI